MHRELRKGESAVREVALVPPVHTVLVLKKAVYGMKAE